MPGITISLSEDIVGSVRIPPDEIEEELRKELAVALYARQVLSMGKARKLANITVWEFRQLVAKHKLVTSYNDADLAEDIAYANSDS